MLIKSSIKDFIALVDSSSPAPGGGSVSALASTLGSALSRMVGHLTITKKSFAKLEPSIQIKMISKMEMILEHQAALLSLIDQDTDAFNKMMDAYSLPKETEEDKKHRFGMIQKATVGGIEVPLSVMRHSLAILDTLDFFVKYGNKTAISDIGVGCHLLYSGIMGAYLNVKINLPTLKDEELKNAYLKESTDITLKAFDILNICLGEINHVLDQSMV